MSAENANDPVTVTYTRAEAGLVLMGLRAVRRKKEKSIARSTFDPVLGAGAIRALDLVDSAQHKTRRAMGR